MRTGVTLLRAARAEGVVILTLGGTFGLDELPAVDTTFARHPSDDVVIDLTSCTLASFAAIEALDPERWERPQGSTCVACRRPSSRQLITRAGVARRMAVFQCVADALQCHVMARAGYGSGWMLTPGLRAVTSLDDHRQPPRGPVLPSPRTDTLRRAHVRRGAGLPATAQ
jgi:hypothetical protein